MKYALITQWTRGLATCSINEVPENDSEEKANVFYERGCNAERVHSIHRQFVEMCQRKDRIAAESGE